MISVVIPTYNEEENVPVLYEKLKGVLDSLNEEYEIIFVDDGSYDRTPEILKELADKDKRVKVIRFRRNYGQTAAMYAGFEYAKGDVIITMDADLQNDPEDIPKLLEKLQEGYDIVSGWRKDRKDPFLSRKLPSRIANWIISRVTGVELHDYGCTLKAYRADIAKRFRLYGDMHRFLPALANRFGARVTEIPVKHHPRLYGKSKYGIGRTVRVILDIFLVKFLNEYITKPLYVFGGFGFLLLCVGVVIELYLTFVKLFTGEDIGGRPLLILGVLLILAGIQLLSTGIIAELIIRTYYESRGEKPYVIDEKINLEEH
ncbi:glycosyltransferase involved in cell wall biosynthesis [Hydrogenivirga caldilitoris]|uniref:Glycosyltransferase involved in cell wall biosynthesis n=1 Tax=Hydrogenivirga caldilitoris TaxID=246264 RepID=A0A497XP38_9AQUI|nr:glycosyltransferase family 2 protein [Hydrogenivirga caldilitoris]RLJ70031.1 glycosyltransferase involved in cell wall biosynthesis [Hydrogenivirga caldilitoris]